MSYWIIFFMVGIAAYSVIKIEMIASLEGLGLVEVPNINQSSACLYVPAETCIYSSTKVWYFHVFNIHEWL